MRHKKRIFFYIIACLLFSVNLQAQHTPNGRQGRQEHRQFNPEEFDKWMESYITNEVGLNAEEGKKFFPLLKEMRIKQSLQIHFSLNNRKVEREFWYLEE